MTPAGSDIGEYCQMLKIDSRFPDDGQKHRPKHVELTRNTKLTYIVATRWLLSLLTTSYFALTALHFNIFHLALPLFCI
jgi:hypothetical protein